jgi:hypothetical protein
VPHLSNGSIFLTFKTKCATKDLLMKRIILFLALTLCPVLSYAQSAYSFDQFSSNQDNSDYNVWLAKGISFPEDEFSLNMAKRHYEIFTECTCDGVPVDLNRSTFHASLSLLEENGKYKLSFSILILDKKGNPVDSIGETYYDGVVAESTNTFVSSMKRSYVFKDGDVIAQIETQGEYYLKISFGDKPLYGVFSGLRFKMKQ